MIDSAPPRKKRGGASLMNDMMDVAAEQRAALVRFVYPRVKDHAVAEDIVHDVLLRAWEKRAQLRDESKLSAWLYQMTRFAIVDHHRAHRSFDELPETLAATENDDLAVQQLAQCLTPMIARLPERYRIPLEMTELQGLSQQEVANRLSLSLSGAKSRVQRARAKLQESLMECCRVELDHRGAISGYDCVSGECAHHTH